ncbi:MAG: ABC transporter ATP-binding protein [Parcubacteria group bacterium]|nr:ABC transporter ATP-binding protein [Parcubacteria group bacterium]
MIRLENLNLYYDKGKPSEVWALKNVNLKIEKGEYVAFFGPSGCGKTSLLYTIGGIDIDKITGGSVVVNDRNIREFSNQELAIYRQMGIGIVFQQFNLIPSISALDNVALPMAFLGISSSRRREEALALLGRLGIENLADRYPHELSGGQQQRVGIARALANNPPIIVADEPLGNLDSENANKVLEFLKELNEKDGRTVIMVTHEAWSLRDVGRIFYMKDGEIVKVDEPKTRLMTAKSVSSYLYRELYPELGVSETSAVILANLFLRGYSVDEMKRFEFFLLRRMAGEMDGEAFKVNLDKPFREGGVGLWRQKAEKIARSVEEMIERKKEIEDVCEELERNPATPLYDEVKKIGDWLIEDYAGIVSDIQKIRLEEIISERIQNVISAEHFKRILNLSKGKFGLGLSLRATERISEKLEAILVGNGGLSIKLSQ